MENNGGFNVLVNPNVDYAFIVALLMIVKDVKVGIEIAPGIKLISSVLSVALGD